MGMTVRFNPRQLEAAISQVGERAIKGMSDRMRKIAIKTRDLARDYAPHRTGLLEDEIDYATIRQAGRNVYVVYINLDAARRRGQGELGDYAFTMEEELHPYGRQRGGHRYYRLGPGSIAKAAGGKKVGGRFLARAVKEATASVPEQMLEEVRRVLGNSRSIPINYERDFGDDE